MEKEINEWIEDYEHRIGLGEEDYKYLTERAYKLFCKIVAKDFKEKFCEVKA